MADLVAEFRSPRLYGLASGFAELQQGGVSQLQMADAVRYQMHAARFAIHRDLAGFDPSPGSIVARSSNSPPSH